MHKLYVGNVTKQRFIFNYRLPNIGPLEEPA